MSPWIDGCAGVSIYEVPGRSENTVARLGELLEARMVRNSRLSLSEALVAEGGLFEPDDELLGYLIRNRRELSSWMFAALREKPRDRRWEQSPGASLRDLLIPWLEEKNQYIRLDEEASLELETLYRYAVRDTARVLSSRADDARTAAELRGVWEVHRWRLASFVRARLGEEPHDAMCAGYSPPLQLGVLGLDSEGMAEPVLDVGCGREAALVRHLRERGVEAYGIDRAAPEGLRGVVAVDWLEFDYGEDVWGTVISHLGFSLHFLRHHLAGGQAAEALAVAHAQAYARLVRSLRVGGSFVYAPALPFVEALLPASAYRCESIAPLEELMTPALIAAREDTGLDLARATRVLRLAGGCEKPSGGGR